MTDFNAMLAVQVALLFRSHDDLLQEFTYFLPDSSVPQVSPTLATAWHEVRATINASVKLSSIHPHAHGACTCQISHSYRPLHKHCRRESSPASVILPGKL